MIDVFVEFIREYVKTYNKKEWTQLFRLILPLLMIGSIYLTIDTKNDIIKKVSNGDIQINKKLEHVEAKLDQVSLEQRSNLAMENLWERQVEGRISFLEARIGSKHNRPF